MKKWNLIIDVAECEDCNNCFLACKDEHVGNDFPGYSLAQPRHGHRWMNIMRKERGSGSLMDVAYRPTPCMHCDQPPCISTGGDAVVKKENGIVMIDPGRAKGRRDIVDSCPYRAIWWNDELEVPQKCGFCAHLLENGWKEPRCTQVCPTGSLRVLQVEDREMEAIILSEHLEVLHPEYGTRPRVYYRNLYRFERCFIGGSVVIKKNGQDECAGGARVTLFNPDGEKIAEQATDDFGDFKFDGLEEDSGTYVLEIYFTGFAHKTLEVDLGKSLNIGAVNL